MSDSVFIDIDVSSQTLEVANSEQAKTWQFANDAAGIEQLVSQASALGPVLVVLEATGGYEFEAACALQAAGLAVAVVNPRTARDFALAMGALAKLRRSSGRRSSGAASWSAASTRWHG